MVEGAREIIEDEQKSEVSDPVIDKDIGETLRQ